MCPHCGSEDTRVLETRMLRDAIYRRRRCGDEDCGKVFVSEEKSTRSLRLPRELRSAINDRLNALPKTPTAKQQPTY